MRFVRIPHGLTSRVKVAEPTTTITDALLAAESLFLSALLSHCYANGGSVPVALWAGGFVATGISAAAGGVYHGFPQWNAGTRSALWKCVIYSIGLTSLLLFSGAAIATTSGATRLGLLCAAGIQFCVYAVWMIRHNEFKYIILDYVPAMLGILLLQALRFHAQSSPWIIGGILVSFAAAGVQLSGFRRRLPFNHNDLYHLTQMLAMYLLYRGALLF